MSHCQNRYQQVKWQNFGEFSFNHTIISHPFSLLQLDVCSVSFKICVYAN